MLSHFTNIGAFIAGLWIIFLGLSLALDAVRYIRKGL